MSIIIREGNIRTDDKLIANALNRYLTPRADWVRFEWLYKRNPHGRVRVWLAFDGNQLIGTAAAFPRRVYVLEQEKCGWVFGDFCVSDRYRSLGPAVVLQRALLENAQSAGIAVFYDFPSTAMSAVYKRLKFGPASQMIRMAKVLRVNRKVREELRNEALATAISSVANFFLRASMPCVRIDRTIKISLLESGCGPEFDALADRVELRFDICVLRSSDYLNWRYLANPYKKHELMTAKRDGFLLGFVVFSQNGVDAEIVDIFGVDGETVGRLIDEVIKLSLARGIITISVELVALHPWTELFNKMGFYQRESKPFFLDSTSTEIPWRSGSNPAVPRPTWFIMGGDRDS